MQASLLRLQISPPTPRPWNKVLYSLGAHTYRDGEGLNLSLTAGLFRAAYLMIS